MKMVLLALLSTMPLPLPGSSGPVFMDYLAYDAARGQVWVPAGNSGRVNVLDVKTGAFRSIEGFDTLKQATPRGERTVGPSSATVGPATVYIGNRAGAQVCAVDASSLKRGACVKLDSSPDGVAYVATTKEVWVTTPRDKSLTLIDVKDAAAPVVAGKISLDGAPEGYAVDAERGLFYTNLEDKDRTLVVDVRTRKVVNTFNPGCGEEGPRGLVLDRKQHLILVACTDKAVALADKDGALRGSLPTGGGVDNIDFDEPRRTLYVASGKAATLTLIHVAQSGALSAAGSTATAKGARVVVSDGQGDAYIADSAGGRLLRVHAPR